MKRAGLLILLLLAVHGVEPLPSVSAHPATDVVENLHRTLLIVMKDGNQIGYQGRYDRLAPVITAGFDMPFIAKTAVGRYWETFNNEQKSKFVETFSKLSIATYAFHFDVYSGERFNFILEKDLRDGQILIQTQLIKSDGGKVQLDYVLHRNEDQWYIINVITDGVSLSQRVRKGHFRPRVIRHGAGTVELRPTIPFARVPRLVHVPPIMLDVLQTLHADVERQYVAGTQRLEQDAVTISHEHQISVAVAMNSSQRAEVLIK